MTRCYEIVYKSYRSNNYYVAIKREDGNIKLYQVDYDYKEFNKNVNMGDFAVIDTYISCNGIKLNKVRKIVKRKGR